MSQAAATALRLQHPGGPDAPVDDRRGFLRTALAGAGWASAAPALWLAGCAAPGGPRNAAPGTAADSDPVALYRLVNRLSWGATDEELARATRLGAAGYIDEQLRAAAGPLPAAAQAQIDALSISREAMPAQLRAIDAQRKSGEALPTEDARKSAQQAYQQALTRLAREAGQRRMLRALYSPDQWLEQMEAFWFNHFNVHQYKGPLRAMIADYEAQALRPNALGRFRTLLGAVARHPAMLSYLDNNQNGVNRINENYARELLELHTLGVDGGYSQRDVQELARVLTGHAMSLAEAPPKLKPELAGQWRREGLYEFNPARHDYGDKQLLGRTVRGRGAAELDEVLDLLAMHPSTARFVCTKLARQFLADEPPARLVEAMQAAWLREDGQLVPVLRVLLTSTEFSAPTQPGKFKDPMHFVVSAVRACYGSRVVLSTQPLINWMNRLGQGLYNRQTPDGYPSQAAAWSGSGQMATRFEIARTLASSSAGLFKGEDAMSGREEAAFPQLQRPLYHQVVRPLLGEATRAALDSAGSQTDWNTLYLSSPEFMYL